MPIIFAIRQCVTSVMVALGAMMFLVIVVGLICLYRQSLWQKRWLLRFMLYMIPAPWVAALCGWFVTEHGRQPWTVYNILPTTVSASGLNAFDILFTLIIFALLYLLLLAVEMYLMFKYARLGPDNIQQ